MVMGGGGGRGWSVGRTAGGGVEAQGTDEYSILAVTYKPSPPLNTEKTQTPVMVPPLRTA